MESIIFLGMNPDMWIVLLTILVVFGLMLFTKLPGDYVFMGAWWCLSLRVSFRWTKRSAASVRSRSS